MACGIFLDQGSNPCLLYCQTDSYPLSRESPGAMIIPNKGFISSCGGTLKIGWPCRVFHSWDVMIYLWVVAALERRCALGQGVFFSVETVLKEGLRLNTNCQKPVLPAPGGGFISVPKVSGTSQMQWVRWKLFNGSLTVWRDVHYFHLLSCLWLWHFFHVCIIGHFSPRKL